MIIAFPRGQQADDMNRVTIRASTTAGHADREHLMDQIGSR